MPGAELSTKSVTKSSSRKHSSFQMSGKYVKATEAHLALWCAKYHLWAAAKIKFPQMTKAPARACKLDTHSLPCHWPLLWHRLPGGRGAALAACRPLCTAPWDPCPRQVFRAKQPCWGGGAHHWSILSAFLWQQVSPVDEVPIAGRKKIPWCDSMQKEWCCLPKWITWVHSKPALWWEMRHCKGQGLQICFKGVLLTSTTMLLKVRTFE